MGDIEQSTITNFDPNTNMSSSNGGAEGRAPPPEDAAVAPSWVSVVISWLVSTAEKPMIIILSIPVCIVAALGLMIFLVFEGDKYCVPDSIPIITDRSVPADEIKGSLYEKVHMYRPRIGKVRVASARLIGRLGCVLLLWLLISIPALKKATFLGVIHWKWSLLAALLLLSHPFITFTLATYIEMSHNQLVDPGSQMHYYSHYIWCGLSDSLASLIHIASVFLVWKLYFHAREGINGGFDKYATRTLAALLVAAVLWLLKTALLLRWQQKAIYEKFRPRILMSAFRLYILCCFFDNQSSLVLLPCRYLSPIDSNNERDYLKSSFFSKRNAREYIVNSSHVSLAHMNKVTEVLTVLTKISAPRSSDDAHQLSAVMDAYKRRIYNSFSNPSEAKTQTLIEDLDESDQILLKDVLEEEYPSKDLNQVPFDKWVVDAHKSCLSTSYTLTDAFAMVSVLDTILTSCLVMAVIVVWLLATELASTTVLVVIASPFLALSFVFGDICKNFFQGFIFAFVSHPFDIGDRCIINGDEVEVKRVNIMTTTCIKIGTNEKMMYPNSNISANLITNLGDKLDPSDVVELVLHPSTKMKDILDMKKHIENFIDSDAQRVLFEKAHKVVVKEINNGIKIMLYFHHTMDGRDVSFSQFLEKKEGQRSTLFLVIKEFLENLDVEVATS